MLVRVLVGGGEERQALGKMASLLWCWNPEEQEVVYVRFFFFVHDVSTDQTTWLL